MVNIYLFFTFKVPFERLFFPTLQSQMSKIFRDLEFLGKVMERGGFRFEAFTNTGCKIAAQF